MQDANGGINTLAWILCAILGRSDALTLRSAEVLSCGFMEYFLAHQTINRNLKTVQRMRCGMLQRIVKPQDLINQLPLKKDQKP